MVFGCVILQYVFYVILVIHQAIVYNNVIFCFRSLNPFLPITIIFEHIHSSISSSTGATPRKKRPPLSDIKTWLEAWRPTHASTSSSSKQLGTAAKQTNGLGDKAQTSGFTSPKRPREVVVLVVGVFRRQREEVTLPTVGSVADFTFRRSRGIVDHHHHHRGE